MLWFRSAAALNVSFVPRLLLILLSHLTIDVKFITISHGSIAASFSTL